MLTSKFHGKTRLVLTAIGVLQIYFAAICANIMDPALQNLNNMFPNVTHKAITSLITIPNLSSIPASILSGILTGRRLKYRRKLQEQVSHSVARHREANCYL